MNGISEQTPIEEIREIFASDQFARNAGCCIEQAKKGYAVCTMELRAYHRNAMNNVMGGAIFTLADFALAVACNVGNEPTVSVESDIKYLKLTRGNKLIATAVEDRSGRHLGAYTITITDDQDQKIAIMTATTYR